jgi:hypothetical protein
VPFSWVTADEAYGGNPAFRADLRERGVSYVVAVACNTQVHTQVHTQVEQQRALARPSIPCTRGPVRVANAHSCSREPPTPSGLSMPRPDARNAPASPGRCKTHT